MTKPMKMHLSLTADRILDAMERAHDTLDSPGFCISCGYEQDEVEPDAKNYKCENCGEKMVFGVEELLLEL